MKLKRLLKLNQKGFGHVEAVIAVAVIVMVAAVGIYINKHNHGHAATIPKVIFSVSDNSNYSLYQSNGTSAATVLSSQSGVSYISPEWTQNASAVDYINTNLNDGNNYKLYTMNSNGTNPTLVINKNVSGYDWSESANKLAYAAVVKGDTELFTSNADGSGATKIYTFPNTVVLQPNFNVKWSPNGQLIEFETFNFTTQASKFFTISSSGSNLSQLPSTCGFIGWTDDSSKIVCYGAKGLYTVDSNGSNLTAIPNSAPGGSWGAVSPTNNEIAYNYTSSANNCLIYVINLNGTGKKQVYSSPDNEECEFMDWSPSGSRIAFTTSSEAGSSVYSVTPSGSGLDQLYTSSSSSNSLEGLDWSIQ